MQVLAQCKDFRKIEITKNWQLINLKLRTNVLGAKFFY
jgi:hypothetical protein